MNEKLLKFLLILLVCIPISSTDIFIPALPVMVNELHTNLATIGLVLSSYMTGLGISMLTTGTLSDMYGRRKILIITMLLYIFSSLLITFCHNIYLLILLRFFQGLGGGSGTVVARLIIKDYYPEKEQVNMMSSLSTGMALAPAVAPQIGAWCTSYFKWQSCFAVTFIAGCLILWLLLFKLQETNKQLTSKNPIKQLPLSFIQAFNTKEFTGFTLLITFAWCAYFSFIGLSGFLFQDVYLYSKNQFAGVIGTATFGYLIGTTLARVLNKRNHSIQNIICVGVAICFIAGLLFLASYLMHLGLLIMVSAFILRLGIGLIMPTSQVGAMRFHTVNTGWYMGCLFFVEFIMGSITLYLAGFLEVIHIGLGMVCSVLISILILFLGYYLIRQKV